MPDTPKKKKQPIDSVPFEQRIEDEREHPQTGGGTFKRLMKRWFVDGMGAMALGLFASLVVGLIISQLSQIPGLSILGTFAEILSSTSPVVGAAVGVAIAYSLKVKPLVMFASAATGAFGYALGGPVGAYIAGLVGAEIGSLVAGKTPVDIVVAPMVTIIAGCAVGWLAGPPLSQFMTWLGSVINAATTLSPVLMSMAVAIIVGMALTGPISSAALCIMLGLDGFAAGAAVAGCCAQMVGFAVMSFPDNGWGGFLAQGLGTSKLQLPNVLRRPVIWLPPILASVIIAPLSTVVFQMTNTSVGAGMGTSGLVGQFGAWAAMSATTPAGWLIAKIVIVHFVMPLLLTLLIAIPFRKKGWIRPGDLKLQLLK